VDEPPPPSTLNRYRIVQVISILLIGLGIVGVGSVLLAAQSVDSCDPPSVMSRGDALTHLAILLGGGLALTVGLLLNAVRALVVRAGLPPSRYRGPAIVVLLLIASVAATIGSVAAAGDAFALTCGGDLTVGGTLLLLTATQASLALTGAAFVALPRALEGARLLPTRAAVRSVLIGLGLAIPAWIAANVIGAAVSVLLDRLGMLPPEGVVTEAVTRADPTVLVLALVIVAPIAEEIFFRGIVFNAWEREYGPAVAVYGSAALFGVIHGSIVAFVPIFVLGIVLARLYRGTRSLPATMTLHAAFNAITVTLALLARAGILDVPLT
jgi:membrane protease YdiL (CAAX protease family)